MHEPWVRLVTYIVFLGGLDGLWVILLPLGDLGVNLVGQILDQTAGLAVLSGLGQLRNGIGQLASVGLGLGLDQGAQLVAVLNTNEREKLVLQCLDGIVGLLDNVGQGQALIISRSWCIANASASDGLRI